MHTVPARASDRSTRRYMEQRLASDGVLPSRQSDTRLPIRVGKQDRVMDNSRAKEDAKAIVKESSEEGIEEIAKRLKSAHAKQMFEAMTESERSELIERYTHNSALTFATKRARLGHGRSSSLGGCPPNFGTNRHLGSPGWQT